MTRVDMGKPIDTAPHEHRVHGQGGHAESVGDLDRAEPLLPRQVHDLAQHRCRPPMRPVMRLRGPIEHPGRPFLGVAVGPLLRGAPGDVVRNSDG